MSSLVYTAITSLDGYTNDSAGRFDWSAPDEEVHAHVNSLERGVGTYLLGRRMYEVMKVWQEFGTDPAEPEVIREYGELWRAAEKVVFSTGLAAVETPRTRLERTWDPDAVRALKAAADSPLSIGGATLAGSALRAGLVDEVNLYLNPVIVGGGTRALPDGVDTRLELRGERRFSNGVVYLSYAVRGGISPSA